MLQGDYMPSRFVRYLVPSVFYRNTREASAANIELPVTEVNNLNLDSVPSISVAPRIRTRLENLVKLVGVNAISARNGVDRAYNLSEGTMLGLCFDEKFHEYDSAYVRESEIRRACTGKMIQQSAGRSVVWLEAAGVMESGSGAQGTLMLGDFNTATGALNFGFSTGSVLRFRTSQAFAIGSEESKKKLIDDQTFHVPKTASEAKVMPFGSEVEIVGQGKVNADATFSLRAGPSVAMATAGAAIDLETHSNVTGEISLNVTALDGYRRVRVTLRKIDSESVTFSAAFRAGLIFPPGSLQPAPSFGAGLLKYLVAILNYQSIEELVNAYTTFSARYAYSHSHKGTIIASYDFDLNNPAAAEAYEEMVKLSTSKAQNLSKRATTGIVKVLAEENETSSSQLVDLTLLGEKLYLRETLRTERSGRLVQNGQEIMVYRDSMYKKRVESWFAGIKDIEWQAVSVHDKVTDQKKPYFRFHFHKKDYDGSNIPKIDAYFRFAQSMGIYSSELTENIPESLGDYNAALSTAEEVDTDIDIYFTKKGVHQIDAADKLKAYQAYMDASSEIFLEYKNLPFLGEGMKSLKVRELIREHRSIEENAHTAGNHDTHRIVKEYWSLTGRDLKKDVALVKDAEKFATAIDALKDATDPEQIARFFPKFGEKDGFNFMQTISALQKLARPDNTLIHSLSMSGAQISLQSRDEGVMEHPRETVMDVLTRAV
jgi:hypothetical protein